MKNFAKKKNALKKFKGNYLYLKTIARANGKKPFDRGVVEAFWIGNPLLRKVNDRTIRKLILKDLCKAGMDKIRAKQKVNNLPKGIFLHHSFNSLYLEFVGNKVKRTISNYDKCRIGWGEVLCVGKERVQEKDW